MKKLFLIAITSVTVLGAITGCKKSDSSSSATAAYSMKATIGSNTFNASNCVAIASNGSLTITGWTGNSTSAIAPMINMLIVSWNQGTGPVNFDSTLVTGYAQYEPTTTSTLTSKTGTVNITSVSTTAISGTYSFTATDGTAVTAGTFTAKR